MGAGCFDRQNLSRLAHVFRQAITQWGAPDTVVSDHGAVFLALQPCLAQLGIQPSADELPVGQAETAFDDDGRLLDPEQRAALAALIGVLAAQAGIEQAQAA